MPKFLYTHIIVIYLLSISNVLSAQKIHAIICGGTSITDIGEGCEASIDLIEDALKIIGEQSEMVLETHLIIDEDFNKKNIIEEINNLQPSSDDVIFFYSTSHGFNYNDNISRYTFIMAHPHQPEGFNELDKYGLSLEKDIFNVLKSKGARLTISMAEACNNILDFPSPNRYKAMTPIVARNIKALFKEYDGDIIACSSTLGQYSYTDLDNGGFFTNMFMEALNDVVTSTRKATWENLMQLTIEKTQGFADARGKDQIPQTNIIDTSIKIGEKKEQEEIIFKSSLRVKRN